MADGLFCARCGGAKWIDAPGPDGVNVVTRCPECNMKADIKADPGKNKLPGFRKGARATSRKAALAHYPKSGSARLAVLLAYVEVYPEGMTHEELSEKMGNPATSTYRARASELDQGGWLIDSGKKRKTRSGEDSVVWVLSDYGARRCGVLYRLSRRSDGND